MTEIQKQVITEVKKLQPAKAEGPVWLVGEQIKDIVRREPDSAATILEDISGKNACLAEIEREISKYARAHSGCCDPFRAENIIRKYFGIPEREAPKDEDEEEAGASTRTTVKVSAKVVNLEDFL